VFVFLDGIKIAPERYFNPTKIRFFKIKGKKSEILTYFYKTLGAGIRIKWDFFWD
jgi:hypothetical protein